MPEKIHRELGVHETRIGQLETAVVELRKAVKEIKHTMLQVMGGWKLLLVIVGLLSLGGGVGAALMKLLQAPVHQVYDYWP